MEKRYLVSLENLNEEKINYSKINKKISDMQEKAMVYLSNAIGSVEGNMKFKVGIVTWFSAPNYGTFLQAYALQKYLNLKRHR